MSWREDKVKYAKEHATESILYLSKRIRDERLKKGKEVESFHLYEDCKNLGQAKEVVGALLLHGPEGVWSSAGLWHRDLVMRDGKYAGKICQDCTLRKNGVRHKRGTMRVAVDALKEILDMSTYPDPGPRSALSSVLQTAQTALSKLKERGVKGID